MPKRFTDTEKWKKPFIRGLQGSYKLLWFYILDDCDHAGIWQVDFEVARIRIGEAVDMNEALRLFGGRVHQINKFRWFLPDFINFQYGELTEKNRMHKSVIEILNRQMPEGAWMPLVRGQGQGIIQGQGEGTSKGTIQAKTKLEIFEELLGDQQYFDQLQMTHKGKNIQQAFEECYTHHSNGPNPPHELWEWRQKLNTWLTIKGNGKGTSKNNKQSTSDLAAAFAERVRSDATGM